MNSESVRNILKKCSKEINLTDLVDGEVTNVKLTDFKPNEQNNIEFKFRYSGVWKGEVVQNKRIYLYRKEWDISHCQQLHYCLLWLERYHKECPKH